MVKFESEISPRNSSLSKVRHIPTHTPPVEDWRRDEQTALRAPRGPGATGSGAPRSGPDSDAGWKRQLRNGLVSKQGRSSGVIDPQPIFLRFRVPHSGMTDS